MVPRTLAIELLTKAGFAPFGTVIERDGAETVSYTHLTLPTTSFV